MPGFGSNVGASATAIELGLTSTTRETKFNIPEFLSARLKRRTLGAVALLTTVAALGIACARQGDGTGGQGGGGVVATAEASDPARAEQEAPHPVDVDLGPLTAEHYPSIETPEQAADLVEHWASRQQWAINELDPAHTGSAEQALADLYDTTTESGKSWYEHFAKRARDEQIELHQPKGTRMPLSPDMYMGSAVSIVDRLQISPDKTWFSFHGTLTSGIATRTDLEMGLPEPKSAEHRFTFRLNDVKRPNGVTEKLWQVTEVRAWSDVPK